MARSILSRPFRWGAWLVLASALFVVEAEGASQNICAGKSLDHKAQESQQQLVRGAFYKELLRRFGQPIACSVDKKDGATKLTYGFRGGARLISRTDLRIEFSEVRVELLRMDQAKAIALLKRVELEAYAPGGCGILWTSGEEERLASGPTGTREIVYRGDTCNCQARLIYQNDSCVSLVLRSAC